MGNVVETGEAGEDTILTCRAKLFQFSKDSKAWKERGIGVLKLNTPIEDDHDNDSHEAEEDHASSTDLSTENEAETSATSEMAISTEIAPKKKKPRLIMRADGVMRVLLNAPILKDMTATIASVNQPNVVSMTIIEDGEPLGIRLRVCFDTPLSPFIPVTYDLSKLDQYSRQCESTLSGNRKHHRGTLDS